MHVIDRFTSETPHGNSMWKKKFVLSLICFVPLDQISNIKYAVRLRVNILRWLKGGIGWLPLMFLNLRRQMRMVPLIMMVLLWMKRMRVFCERRVWEHVSLNQKQKRGEKCSRLWHILIFHPICLNHLPYSPRALKRIKRHRKRSSIICEILEHGQSRRMGEEPSVPIFMLIPAVINTVWSIQPLWTASQIT